MFTNSPSLPDNTTITTRRGRRIRLSLKRSSMYIQAGYSLSGVQRVISTNVTDRSDCMDVTRKCTFGVVERLA